MSMNRLFCLALAGCAYLGLAGPAASFDSRHIAAHPVSTVKYPGMLAGIPLTARTTAQILYVVPVVPRTPGIRAAPVGQPVIYVIEHQDEADSVRAGGRRNAAGPRVRTIEP